MRLGSTAEAFAALACVGDCDDSLGISSEELRLGVEIALLRAPRDPCSRFDANRDGGVTVDELVLAVRAKNEGCDRLPCDPAPLEVNQRVVGQLAGEDCTDGTFQGNYSDFYSFSAFAGDRVSIRLSAGFDTYVALTQPGGGRIISDNCPGDGLNSCIPDDAPLGGTMLLSADGEHLVEVTSFSFGASGSYALTVTLQQGTPRSPTATSTITPTSPPTRTATRTAPPTSSSTLTPSRTPTPMATATPTQFSPLIVAGHCRRPGISGLVPCDAGRMVEVWRCDETKCLQPEAAKSKLGEGAIGSAGAFSIVVNDLALGSHEMLVEAEASLAPATIYRILDVGSLGGGSGAANGSGQRVARASLAAGAGGGSSAGMLEIDPSSEGAMRAIDADPNPLGIDAFSNADIQNLVQLTRAAAGTYAGKSAEEAAAEAFAIATDLGKPRILSFVASSGLYTYHALSSGAFAHHFTTMVATTVESETCTSSSGVLAAGAVALSLPGADLVRKSQVVESQSVVFNAPANGDFGRLCLGAGCLNDATCPGGTGDCQVFAYDQNATPINLASLGVSAAHAMLVPSNAVCALEDDAFVFGAGGPTTLIDFNSPKPSDGFTLPASSTIVFVQPTQMGGEYVFGVGGFRLRAGVTTTGAVAQLDQGSIAGGTATPTSTPVSSATRSATITATRTRTATSTVPTSTATPPPSTLTPTVTAVFTATASVTLTPVATATSSRTSTPASTATFTPTTTPSASATSSRTATASPSSTPTQTPSSTLTSTRTPTPPPTPTFTRTATASRTPSVTPTAVNTATFTRTATATRTFTQTRTQTGTSTPSATPTHTGTPTATRTPTSTRTPTPTRTATRTRTVTPTPTSTPTRTATGTVTPTPQPFLVAHIATNRGCIETGNDPVYSIGEAIQIFYQVDSGSPQAQVTITDFPPGGGSSVILSSMRPTNQTFAIGATVGPPVGTESLLIEAQNAGLSSESQCSFHVVAVDECATACDCPTGQQCTVTMGNGVCEMGMNPIYCCSGICPMGATCQEVGGGFFVCP